MKEEEDDNVLWGSLDPSLVELPVLKSRSSVSTSSEKKTVVDHQAKRPNPVTKRKPRKKAKKAHSGGSKSTSSTSIMSSSSEAASSSILLMTGNVEEIKASFDPVVSGLEEKERKAQVSRERHLKEMESKSKKNEKLLDCSFWLEGKCNKGDRCTFSHAKQPPLGNSHQTLVLCKFLISGVCTKGLECPFSHDTKAFPCRYHFLTSRGCENGDQCCFSHKGPLSDEKRAEIEKQWQEEKLSKEQ